MDEFYENGSGIRRKTGKWYKNIENTAILRYSFIMQLCFLEGRQMRIRKAEREDQAAIERIYEEILTAQDEGKLTTGWIRGVYPTGKTAEEAIRRQDMYVLEDEGEIRGAGVINEMQVDVYEGAPWRFETDRACVLHTLVIAPGSARKGYGSAFIRFYESHALEEGLPELRIDTNANNTAARAMYRRLGFAEIGTVPTTFNGIPGVNLVLLEKNLKS